MRPMDIVKEIDSLHSIQGLVGIADTDMFPLNDDAVNRLDAILAMLDEIPRALLQGAEKSNYEVSVAAIKNGIAKFKARSGRGGRMVPPDPLRTTVPSGFHPVALLRQSLLSFPNYTPMENRRRILDALANYQAKDLSAFIPDSPLSGLLGVEIGEMRKQLEILEDDQMIELRRLNNVTLAARLTPRGWKSLESLNETEDDQRPIVFISCGQYSQEEIDLGKSLAKAVNELTSSEGYFAQNQSSLEGLTRHIFGALNRCVAFVAVLHHRGLVRTPDGELVRASVWIEQEIAIAAFLAQAQGRDLPVVVYIQNGIAREGVRQQLLLGPVNFGRPEEVLEDFKRRLREGLLKSRVRTVATG